MRPPTLAKAAARREGLGLVVASGLQDTSTLATTGEERDLPDWERQALEEAVRVEEGYGTRYIAIPHDETYVAYGDMEAFISTVRAGRRTEELSGNGGRAPKRSAGPRCRRAPPASG